MVERTTQELIRKYNILCNRMNAFTVKTPLRYKVNTSEEIGFVIDELRARGLYHAGNGRFVTIPE